MSSVIDENTQFIDPLTSTPILNGYIYIGANGLDAVLNAITIYSDRDLITPLSNPQRTDSSGRSVNKIWVPGRYSMKITDSAGIQKLNDLDLGELAAIGTTKLTNVQGSDIITAEGSPTITTLTDGQLYVFTTILANAGAVTLQIDATPVYPIKKNHDVALVANDLESSQMIVVAWNSTDSVYELQSSIARASNNLSGQELILDADGDTSITADTDDRIDFKVGASDILSLDSTGILDANKNEILQLTSTASAVNDLTLANAATGNNPSITVSGADATGIDILSGAINEAKGADIASAATTDIGAATGNMTDLTGSATITGLGTAQAGTRRITRTTGTPTFTYNATSMILPGDADIVAQVGDIQEWVSLGSVNWICTKYQRDEATIHPGTISGYVSGVTEYIEADTGVDTTGFDVDAVISTAWESVGPTGSSATNIWSDMDIIPAGAKWVEIKIHNTATDTAGTSASQRLYGRKTGSVAGPSDAIRISETYVSVTGASAVGDRNIVTSKLPLDANNRFDLYRDPATGDIFICSIYLIGWGI